VYGKWKCWSLVSDSLNLIVLLDGSSCLEISELNRWAVSMGVFGSSKTLWPPAKYVSMSKNDADKSNISIYYLLLSQEHSYTISYTSI
jgi:hypothetical protein